jgi:hypothetical protein
VAHGVQARHLTGTWCPFREALQALEAPLQRQNLLQLHLVLAA